MLFELLVRLFAIVGLLLAVSLFVFVGRDRLVRPLPEYRERFYDIVPYVVILGIVLAANKVARDISRQLSWLVGWNVTGYLYLLDGYLLWPLYRGDTPQVVVFLQSIETPLLTAYFSFVYVYGYVFLLCFPLVAYFVLGRPQPLRRTIVAYGANYVIGVTCYVIFIAYGPRNLDIGEGLLYTTYAQYQLLTSTINTSVNVFPSLHTSLAVTVALLAWTTREEYPLWVPVAAILAGSVTISTMYLGIHWASDVIAGIVLAWISVRVGQRFEDHPPQFERLRGRFRAIIPARSR